MILTTKLKTILLSILIIGATIGSTYLLTREKVEAQEPTEGTPKLNITIVLDAGHGGLDVK